MTTMTNTTIELVGKKCGMTRIFTEDGASIPVSVIEVLPNRVTQIKTKENDGHAAIQVTFGHRKSSHVNKAEAGHFAKAGVEPGVMLHEFPIQNDKEFADVTLGSLLTVERFNVGQYVDVSGKTKGKGFAGVIKRHHFAAQDATHGNSLSHRAPGSIGQRQSPGKVFKGKKMAGHLGDAQRTIQSQKVVRIDADKNLIFVYGGIPGGENNYVIIRSAVKKSEKSKE